MNIPLDRKLGLAAPRAPLCLEDATAIAMGTALTAVFFDRPAGRHERLKAEQDGRPIPPPFIAAELALQSGSIRHVLIVPQGIDTMLSRRLVLRLGSRPMAQIDPDWLQLPQGDLPALTAQLSAEGLRRLLRLVVTTAASLFSAQTQAGLADSILRLMDISGIAPQAAIARMQVAGRTLVTYSTPGACHPHRWTETVAIADGHVIRIGKLDCYAEGGLLDVLLPQGFGPVRIVTFADTPLHLAAADATMCCLPVQAWQKGRSKACRDWLFACAGRGANLALESEPPAAGTEPAITVRHLSRVPGGILHALVLADPSRLVRKVLLEGREGRAELTPDHKPDGLAMLAGLADLPGAMGGAETCRIRILDHAGRLRLLAEAPVSPYDGTIPAGFEDAWSLGTDVLRPLAQARAGFHRPAPYFATQHFGPVQKCRLRIVTSISDSIDPIRALSAVILAEGAPAPVEVVCTMTDGLLAAGARLALDQTAAIYGIPLRLVLLPVAANAAERLQVALADARDVPALVLGANVLPGGSGWLAFWLRRLRRQDALAPALLASDGSIAATREGKDPWQGLPAMHLPASARPTGRPLAHCLALGPAGIAQLLDADMLHPDPAVWIARALKGSARTETRFPFHRIGPAPMQGGFAAALAETEFALIEKSRG